VNASVSTSLLSNSEWSKRLRVILQVYVPPLVTASVTANPPENQEPMLTVALAVHETVWEFNLDTEQPAPPAPQSIVSVTWIS